MKFSHFSATAIVPLLARIVLAFVFVLAGWNKIMVNTDFKGDDANRLIEMGIVDRPPAVTPAALRQDSPPAATSPTTAPQLPRQTVPPVTDRSDATRPARTIDIQAPTGDLVVPARTLHRLTLMLDQRGWPYPWPLAWIAALTELVGGALILVGLFSRIWALGLASVMAVAFYMTSLDKVIDHGLFNLPPADFSTLVVQVALFTLAFGVFLTGPGPFSLDRAIFRPAVRQEVIVSERVEAR
jgi:uncharacterized membrane protein YphA (DoxX/SURF4 family)